MKRKKPIIAVCVALMLVVLPVVLAVGIVRAKPWLRDTPMTPGQVSEFQYCREDSECIAVHNGCCRHCPVGGEGTVWINRKYETRFKNSFEKNCICPQCMRIGPATSDHPRCENSACTGEQRPI